LLNDNFVPLYSQKITKHYLSSEMIDQATIDRVIETAEITEVVQDYITLKRRGANFLGLCPFHNEKTPSFTVSPAKGIYKCFGCGKGGNSVSFIMDHEHLSFTDSIRHLAKKYNIEIYEKELSEEDVKQKNERESLLIVSAFAQKYFSDVLAKHPDGNAIGKAYFIERGFTEKIIDTFQLGYSVDKFDEFTKEALKKGYKLENLVKSGLTIESNDKTFDRFSGRVMFPIHSISGSVIGFGGRTLRTDKKVAKYLNSPESEIYHKSKILYGLYFAKKAIVEHDKCYLVEGYTDVISMHQAGIENVVASSGTSLTVEQIRLIKRFTENVTILYDGDPAGIKASLRGIDLILEEGLNVKVLLFPEGDDPDSFSKKVSSLEYIQFIKANEKDFISFKTELLITESATDPIQKARLISDVVSSVALIPDRIARSLYIKECSRLLKVDEQILYYEISRIRKKNGDQSRDSRLQHGETPTQSAIDQSNKNKILYDHQTCEYEIIRLMLNYGNEKLTFEDNENNISVATYIINQLKEDELSLDNEQYKIIFDEIVTLIENTGVFSEKPFINHPNPQISTIAVNMLTEIYQLSTIWIKRETLIQPEIKKLTEIVPETIIAYKNSHLVHELKQIEQKLSETTDNEEIDNLMRDYTKLKEIHKTISITLGNRIIT